MWWNLKIPSQGESECLFLSSSDLKSHFEGKLDLVKYIFEMQIFELTKSLNLAQFKKLLYYNTLLDGWVILSVCRQMGAEGAVPP